MSRYANPLDPNPDYDKARTETLKDYAEAGGTRDITKAVEQAIEANKKAHDTFAKMTALQGSAANLAFAARSIDYSKDSEDIFDKAVEAFVENYAKNLIVPKINGKYVIKLEDIFRICTEHYENKKALANEMYESIRDYLLNSVEAKAARAYNALEAKRKALVNTYRNEEKVAITISPFYAPYLGRVVRESAILSHDIVLGLYWIGVIPMFLPIFTSVSLSPMK